MRQRAMIAMALACDPALVIGDEPTTALDVMVQAQILELLERLREELGLSLILITHDLSVIAETCDRVMVMYAGKVAEEGAVSAVYRRPRHPYTQMLLAAIPNIESDRRTLGTIPGAPPDLRTPPPGLPLPSALSAGDGHLPGGRAAGGPLRRRSSGRLPPVPGRERRCSAAGSARGDRSWSAGRGGSAGRAAAQASGGGEGPT